MAEQKVLVYKLSFLSLNIPDFSLFFILKLHAPPEKAPLFEILVGRSIPPAERRGGAHYVPLDPNKTGPFEGITLYNC